jgi:hypothetical protein
MLGDDNPEDADIIDALSQAYTSMYSILTQSKRGFFSTKTTFTTDGITALLPLPDDFLEVLRLDWQPAGVNQPIARLEEIPIQEIHQYTATGPSAVAFIFSGNNLELFPTPPANQSYVLRYVPAPKKLVIVVNDPLTETAVIDGIAGWEERLVLEAIKVFRVAEESDTADVRADIDAIDKRVRADADDRNATQAQRIADVEGYGYGHGEKYPYWRFWH